MFCRNHCFHPILTSFIVLFLHSTLLFIGSLTQSYAQSESRKETGNKASAGSTVNLTHEEKIWIADHPVIRYAIDPLWAPIEFVGENNEPLGLTIQYLQHMENTLGLHFEFTKGLTWTEALDKLKSSQIDLIPAISITHPARDSLNFTSPYLSTSNAIFSAVERAYLGGVESLLGKRIVVVKNYAIHKWLQENHPDLELMTSPDIETALKEVASGHAFAFIGNLVTTSYYIGQTSLSQIKVVGDIDFTNDLVMAIRQDWKILRGIIQKGLDSIPDHERKTIYSSWISIKYYHRVDYSLLWLVLGVAGFILLIFYYWNRRLVSEISNRLVIEKALNNAKLEAEQATRIKSDFLSKMSHEIRTPINAIIGIGHLIGQTELTDQQADYLNKVYDSSEVLLGVIDDILDFSKGDAGRLKLDSITFSLQQVVNKIKSVLESNALEKGLCFTVQIDPDVPDLLIGDAHKLERVLLNLGFNAIKFTDKGHIEVFIRCVRATESPIDKVKLNFKVKDTGIGVSSEQQQKLFEPFSQGDSSITRRYGGSGLGLSICQQFVTLMGGEITVESALGQGSCFSFTALFYAGKQQQLDTLPTPKPLEAVVELQNVKVLLVDDDSLNCFIAKKMLLTFGTLVEVVNTGQEAVDSIKKQAYDIVLMDIQMPFMDGYEATRNIRLDHSIDDLPIVAMTAHVLSEERNKSFAIGMNDYLTKPIDPEQLQRILMKWVL